MFQCIDRTEVSGTNDRGTRDLSELDARDSRILLCAGAGSRDCDCGLLEDRSDAANKSFRASYRHVVQSELKLARLRGFQAIVQKPAGVLRRMGTQPFLVGFGAPAGAVRNDEMAVPDVGHVGEELVVPCQTIDCRIHSSTCR